MMILRRNWTKLIMTLMFVFLVFGNSAHAQSDSDQALDGKAVAGLINEFKEVVSKNAPDQKDARMIGEKWDARRDLTGKTKSEVIELLYDDVKAVIKDSGIQYQIYSIFAFYKHIPIKSSAKTFLNLSEQEKAEFVAAKIDEISVKLSGNKYPFDDNFKAQVTRFLESYARRAGNNVKGRTFGDDLNFVLQRGSEYAPTINAAFDKSGVSRLSGLYVAMIESEFNNNIVGPTGTSGAFGLTTTQAQKFGMSKKDRAVLSKSADIAARLLLENQNYFAKHRMKEFLAVLAWNYTAKKTNFNLNFKFMSDGKNIACPICGLVGNPQRFDQQFQNESFKYIPKFLAAAILGENPGDFGLSTKPLSTLEK